MRRRWLSLKVNRVLKLRQLLKLRRVLKRSQLKWAFKLRQLLTAVSSKCLQLLLQVAALPRSKICKSKKEGPNNDQGNLEILNKQTSGGNTKTVNKCTLTLNQCSAARNSSTSIIVKTVNSIWNRKFLWVIIVCDNQIVFLNAHWSLFYQVHNFWTHFLFYQVHEFFEPILYFILPIYIIITCWR